MAVISVSEMASFSRDTLKVGDHQSIDYLDTGNITNGKIASLEHYSDLSKLPSRARKVVSDGDIIFSTVRPNNRHYGIIRDNCDNLIVSTGFSVIRANQEIVLPEYLYYLLTTDSTIELLQSIAEQSVSTYPSINDSDIGRLLFDLPTMDIQLKIVKIINSMDSRIILNRLINDNLLAIANQLYDQYFPYVIGEELPNGWKEGELGDIIEIHDSKRIPLSGKERAERAKIYPYYGAASITDYVDDYLFDGIYLLLGEDGTVVTDSGAPVLQYVFGKFWVNNHAHILTGKNGYSVDALYLLCQRLNIDAIITGAVQPKISQANLKGIEIVIPPEKNIKEYSERVDSLFNIYRNNILECERLKALRDQLLPKLISGEIDVSTLEILNNRHL